MEFDRRRIAIIGVTLLLLSIHSSKGHETIEPYPPSPSPSLFYIQRSVNQPMKEGCSKVKGRSKIIPLNKPTSHIHIATDMTELMKGIKKRSIDIDCHGDNVNSGQESNSIGGKLYEKHSNVIQVGNTAITHTNLPTWSTQNGVKRFDLGSALLSRLKPSREVSKSEIIISKNAGTAIFHKNENDASKKSATKNINLANTLSELRKSVANEIIGDKRSNTDSNFKGKLDELSNRLLLKKLEAISGNDKSKDISKKNLTLDEQINEKLSKLDEKKLVELKKSVMKKPNLKTLRDSPLTSLAKLIDDVNAISESNRRLKNQTKSVTLTPEKENKQKADVKGTVLQMKTGKGSLAVDSKQKNSLLKARDGTDGLLEMNEGKGDLLAAKDEKGSLVQENKEGKTNDSTDKMKDVKEGLKLTLSKAIDRVEKIVNNKNSRKEDESKAELIDEFNKNTTEAEEKIRSESTLKSNSTANSTVAKEPTKEKAPADPYAEIANGPDRPKLPELKTDDSSPGEPPLMKLNGEASSPDGGTLTSSGSKVSSSPAKAEPLGGQHDIGGLLDSLTDKLNAAGGGVATDQPAVSGNEIKYLQQQMGMQDTDDSMTEKQAAAEQSEQWKNLDKLKEEADLNDAHKLGDGPPKVMSPAALNAPEEAALDKEAMEKINSADDGLGKSLQDKASSLSKFGALDLMKATKGANSGLPEYADADVSAGPDPYSNTERMPVMPNMNSEFSAPHAGVTDFGAPHGGVGEADANEYLNTETNPIASMPSMTGMQGNLDTQDVQSEYTHANLPGNFEIADETAGSDGLAFEDKNEMVGNTRSKTKNDEDSYLTTAMGAMGVDTSYSTRHSIPESIHTIPEAMWSSTSSNADSTYSNNYNTQLFKKNVILRPQKDPYVSPFTEKSSFDDEK